MQRCNRKGKAFHGKCMKNNSARKHSTPPGGNYMQLRETPGTLRMCGKRGARGVGGGESEGGGKMSSTTGTRQRGSVHTHNTPHGRNSPFHPLWSYLSQKEKQTNKTAELESGALVCWVHVCEYTGPVPRHRPAPLEVMLTRNTPRNTLPAPPVPHLHGGTASLALCVRLPQHAHQLLTRSPLHCRPLHRDVTPAG